MHPLIQTVPFDILMARSDAAARKYRHATLWDSRVIRYLPGESSYALLWAFRYISTCNMRKVQP